MTTTPPEQLLTPAEIEAIAVEHESFGFGRVGAEGLTIHGFGPENMASFVTALQSALLAKLREQQPANVVPGRMRCARCQFELTRVTLCVSTGQSGAGGNETEPCPNGCGPLWPVTWEQEARNCWKTSEALFDRAKAAEDALEALRAPGLRAVDAAPVPTPAAQAAQAVPAGMALMPEQPTPEILAHLVSNLELQQSDPEDHRYDDGTAAAEEIYRDLLKVAAPTPTGAGDDSNGSAR